MGVWNCLSLASLQPSSQEVLQGRSLPLGSIAEDEHALRFGQDPKTKGQVFNPFPRIWQDVRHSPEIRASGEWPHGMWGQTLLLILLTSPSHFMACNKSPF